MTDNSQTTETMYDLLDIASDRILSADELARLESLLIENPECRSLYLRSMRAQALLERFSDDAFATHRDNHAAATPENVFPKINEKPTNLSRRRKRFDSIHWQRQKIRFNSFSAVLTALAWAGFSYFVIATTTPSDTRPIRTGESYDFVARITGQHEHQWAESARGIPWNAFLAPGERLNLVEGLVEITYYDGAVVVLEAPTEFVIDSSGAGTLNVGKLLAQAHEGFTITTPSANFIDLGTEFGASVDENGVAELYVFEGKVRAEMIDATGHVLGTVTLVKNEAVQIDARQSQISTITMQPDFFAHTISVGRAMRLDQPSQPMIGTELAYDHVDGYVPVVNLLGQSYRGIGFSQLVGESAWAAGNSSSATIQAIPGGFSYTKSGVTLQTAGNQHIRQELVMGGLFARLDLSHDGPFASFISSDDRGIDQGSLYYSYLSSSLGGDEWNGGTTPAGTAANANTGALLGVIQDGRVHFYVSKIDFNAGPEGEDLWTTWVDPVPGESEAGNIRARTHDRVNLSATILRSHAGWQDYMTHIKFRGGDQIEWDELRVGASFESVTPPLIESSDLPALETEE